jgi:hypothetical protein
MRGRQCNGGVERWRCQCEVISILSDIDSWRREGMARVSEVWRDMSDWSMSKVMEVGGHSRMQ